MQPQKIGEPSEGKILDLGQIIVNGAKEAGGDFPRLEVFLDAKVAALVMILRM